jgi:hypothetical protein
VFPGGARVTWALASVAVAVPALVGLLILRHRPSHRIGWLLLAQAVSAVLLAPPFDQPSSPRARAVFDQLTQGCWVLRFVWMALIAYLLPDGHPASRRWRRWIQFGVVGLVLFVIGAAGDPSMFADAHDGAGLPLAWLPETMSGLLGVLGLVLTAGLLIGAVPAVWIRLRAASHEDRLMLLWFLLGTLSVPAALAANWLAHFVTGGDAVVSTVSGALVGVSLPTAVGIGVLRRHLFDIELVLSRTLTYGVLMLLVAAAYSALLLAADRLAGNRHLGEVLAVVAMVLLATPLHRWLQRRITRAVYGYRDEPVRRVRTNRSA